jgi:hypothetical protein
MNLDLFPLGLVHLRAVLVAIASGAAVIVRPKGTPVPKARSEISHHGNWGDEPHWLDAYRGRATFSDRIDLRSQH